MKTKFENKENEFIIFNFLYMNQKTDNHRFNLALLAKQGWRLLSNPTSLVAKICKAWYYPDSSSLQARLKANPSYVWRSMLAAARRRIETGDQVRIWMDHWLPDS